MKANNLLMLPVPFFICVAREHQVFAEIEAKEIERSAERRRSAAVHAKNDYRPALDRLEAPVILPFGTGHLVKLHSCRYGNYHLAELIFACLPKGA
jgi:hypothetical protein